MTSVEPATMHGDTPPQRFSPVAFVVAFLVNFFGAIPLSGMRFLDGLEDFSPSRSGAGLGDLLLWLWSPVSMALQSLTDIELLPSWPAGFAVISAVTFGLVFGIVIPWINRPIQP